MSLHVCPRCGRPTTLNPELRSLCPQCFVESYDVLGVPRRLEFPYCKECGSIHWQYRWVEGGYLEEAVAKFIELYVTSLKPRSSVVESLELLRFEFLTQPSWRTVVRLLFSVRLRGVEEPVKVERVVEVYARPVLCERCATVHGGDFNVVVQLRGRLTPEVARAVDEAFERIPQLQEFLVDVAEDRSGVDILLLDRGAAEKLLRELGRRFRLRVTRTGEDVGVTSTGRLRRRLVFSVRILGPRKH